MLKHGKYIYVEVEKEVQGKKVKYYIKVRNLKSRTETSDPKKYIVVGPVRTSPPRRAKVFNIDVLPTDVKNKILSLV